MESSYKTCAYTEDPYIICVYQYTDVCIEGDKMERRRTIYIKREYIHVLCVPVFPHVYTVMTCAAALSATKPHMAIWKLTSYSSSKAFSALALALAFAFAFGNKTLTALASLLN